MTRPASFAARLLLALFLVVVLLAMPFASTKIAVSAPSTPSSTTADQPARSARFAPTAPSEPSPVPSVVLALVGMCAVGALAWWRRRRLPAELASSSIEVIAQASLGGRARVLWLRTAGQSSSRNMVVTVTPQAVHVIDRWPDPAEHAPAAAEPQPIQRARRPGRVRTIPPIFATRAATSASPTSAPSPTSSTASYAPADANHAELDPRSDSRSTAFASHPSDRARPRWDTATHRVIEDRARHLEAAFTGESTFEGIPDELAAELAADLPLLPDEPGAAKPPRSSAELLARAWRRTVSRQPAEAPNAAPSGRRSRPAATTASGASTRAVRSPDNAAAVRSPDNAAAVRSPDNRGEPQGPARAARGSIGHVIATVRPPAASPASRRPILRTALRAKRPASARCRLTFRRRDEGDPQ